MTRMADRDRRDDEARGDRRAEDDRAGRMMEEAVRASRRLLDDPMLPDTPSGLRHGVYFVAVLAAGAILDLVALSLVAR